MSTAGQNKAPTPAKPWRTHKDSAAQGKPVK